MFWWEIYLELRTLTDSSLNNLVVVSGRYSTGQQELSGRYCTGQQELSGRYCTGQQELSGRYSTGQQDLSGRYIFQPES